MVSVKDRAKMFGTLASPGDAGKEKVHSSPIRPWVPPSTKLSPSPFKEKNSDWPDEDGIPAPSPMKNNFGNTEAVLPPVAGKKFSNSPSPFKVLNNQNKNSTISNFDSTKPNIPKRESPSPLKTISMWEERLKPKSAVPDKVESSIQLKKEQKETSTSDNDENNDENKLAEDVNKAPLSRKERLERARGAPVVTSVPKSLEKPLEAAPVVKSVSKILKQSLEAASVVMQEEKSEAGASDASSRSSLSNKELSNIAKRALQSVAASSPSERMNLKASRALAMRMSVGTKASRPSLTGSDVEKTLPTPSSDTSRSRRIDHPAFAARSSANTMLSSFHQFRSFQAKPKESENKESCDEDREDTQSDDDSMQSLEQEESMHSGRYDGSAHSRNGKNMGKIQITKNSCNDTVISSLSGNTQSLQSVPSKMMSPKNNVQNTSLRLEPMPEEPSQAKLSTLDGILTPGPSNRSGHSVANSIISASPRPDYRSPSVRDQYNPSFLDTLEEKSSSQLSGLNSAELLDAALAVEEEDIIDSPRTNPTAFSDGSKMQILSSASHSDSTPGFAFKDADESEHMIASDHVKSMIGEDAGHEGSTSIRTGLSGIQRNSMEQSISIHSTVPNEDKETADVEYPDTIDEENDAKSAQKSKLSKSTATTDGSSGPSTGGSTCSDPAIEGEEKSFSLKRMGNTLKTALVKASPRKNEENDDAESLFDEDEDDIFGDLEVGKEEKNPRKSKTEMKEGSISLRGNGSISHRTSESFSRRKSKPRKSMESGSARKTRTGEKKPEGKEREIIEEISKSSFSKEELGGSFTKFMDDTVTSAVEQKASDINSETIFDEDTMMQASSSEDTRDENESPRLGEMFLKLGYELVDSCNGFANLCTQGSKADDDTVAEGGDSKKKDDASVSSRSELTPLEKRVWREWEKLNVVGALNANKPDEKKTGDKKASGRRTLASESASYITARDSFGDSYISGESFDYSQDDTRDTFSTRSYTTGGETDTMMTDDQGRSVMSKPKPMLLSFSQRSLVEKFSKQMTAVGIQVLKLNTRKQWQMRYFTVSMEQIALSAHEAINKTGEIAQCPKALLWLKKFNAKSGGYGIVNIDKNGHGGMLLVDLVDIQVSERRDDLLENPIPKKLQGKFENSVLLTLKYKMKGVLRSIEFRCKDNDEAQFLCTCMRVIRDLLRRERSLRSKLSKQAALETN